MHELVADRRRWARFRKPSPWPCPLPLAAAQPTTDCARRAPSQFGTQVPNSLTPSKFQSCPDDLVQWLMYTLCYVRAVEHWWATRTTHWADWLAVERATGAGDKPRVVDVRAKIRRRRAIQAAGLSAVMGAAWYLQYDKNFRAVLGW